MKLALRQVSETWDLEFAFGQRPQPPALPRAAARRARAQPRADVALHSQTPTAVGEHRDVFDAARHRRTKGGAARAPSPTEYRERLGLEMLLYPVWRVFETGYK